MNIQLNGESRQLPSEASVWQLINELGVADKRLAVEVNEEIIPRSLYEQHCLQHGDQVEIIHAVGGG